MARASDLPLVRSSDLPLVSRAVADRRQCVMPAVFMIQVPVLGLRRGSLDASREVGSFSEELASRLVTIGTQV
jgi:hypothetical protein